MKPTPCLRRKYDCAPSAARPPLKRVGVGRAFHTHSSQISLLTLHFSPLQLGYDDNYISRHQCPDAPSL